MSKAEYNPMELPAVRTYLDAVKSNPGLADLLDVDTVALEDLVENPDGWDWADHNGARFIGSLWLDATDADAQTTLGQLCHLRALAWDVALEPFSGL